MLNSEWTEEENVQLCSAVAIFGEGNWQAVASVLERRTGTQCSNRLVSFCFIFVFTFLYKMTWILSVLDNRIACLLAATFCLLMQ